MPDSMPNSSKNAMAVSADSQKNELECLRLETDHLQLACVLNSPALKLHCARMARKWANLAACGVEQGYRGDDLN